MSDWWASDALAAPGATPSTPAVKPKAEEKWWEADPVAAGGERTWTGHPAPTTVGEGVRQIGRDVMEAGRRVGGVLESAGKTSKGLLTGEIEPTPENVLPAVAATLMPAQRGTAAAIASVAGRRGPAVGAGEAASSAPRYAQTEKGLARAEQLAGTPFVGKPVREAARKTLDEFEGRVAAADAAKLSLYERAEAISDAAKPTRTGNRLREAAKEEIFFMPGATHRERAANLPSGVEKLRSGGTETAIQDVIELAETNPKALASLRMNSPSQNWSEVSGAAFQRLGLTHEYHHGGAIKSTTFEPLVALEKFEAMPSVSRNVLFGDSKNPFRASLDSLVADGKTMKALEAKLAAEAPKMEGLRRIPTGVTTEGLLKTAGMAGWVMVEPISALTTVIGARRAASMMSKPHTAAALAQWSKAYVRFFQSGGSPAGLAALKVATNNLSNTSGESIDPDKLVEAMRGSSQGVPIREVKVRKNDGIPSGVDPGSLSPYWDENDFNIKGIMKGATRMAPRGIPWESMRPSQNIEVGRQPPFTPPSTYLDTPEEQHDWAVKNIPGYQAQVGRFTREDAREQALAGPPGPLSRAAGLADIESWMQAQRRYNQGQIPPIESVLSTGRGPFEKAGTNSARKSKATEEAERRRRDAATRAGRK